MWTPITSENAKTRLKAAHERAILDLKQRYDLSQRVKVFELAKDIAAFANHLGGSIVVGAIEGSGTDKGRLVALPGLNSNPSTGEMMKAVGDACRLCLPVAIADGIEIELDVDTQIDLVGRGSAALHVVVVNVQPMLSTPIGVFACRDDGTRIDDAYKFPVRTVEGTRFLRPEELAFHMNSHERRMLLQLAQLSKPAQALLWCNSMNGDKRVSRAVEIAELNAELLAVILRVYDEGKEYRAEVPLTFVRAVWASSSGWNVAIEGHALELHSRGTGHLGYVPPGGVLTR